MVAVEIDQPQHAAPQLINLLNDWIRGPDGPRNPVQLLGATPNWLAGSAGNAIIKGGPGSRALLSDVPSADDRRFYMTRTDF